MNNVFLSYSRWYALGEYQKAVDYYEKALRVFEHALGEDHPSTKTTRKNLEGAKEGSGKK